MTFVVARSLCVNHVVGLVLGTYAYYCSVLLTGVFVAIFMVGFTLRTSPLLNELG